MRWPRSREVRYGVLLLVWLLLIGAGTAGALLTADVALADLRPLLALPPTTVAVLLALSLGLFLADLHRYRVVARALAVRVTARAALDAAVANYFFSWTTPGAAFGMPAAVVMLTRHGVSWEAATLISFGKSMTSTAFLLVLAFGTLAAGLGPASDPGVRLALTIGAGVVAAWLSLPVLAMVRPRAARDLAGRLGRGGRWTAGLRDGIERLAQLRSGGWSLTARLGAAHALYFVLLVAIGVLLADALGADSALRAAGASVVFLAFSYVAPTPGGAGLSEASAVLFYGALLAAPEAVVLVLLYRGLTFYLQVAVGALYLPFAGGLRELLARRSEAGSGAGERASSRGAW